MGTQEAGSPPDPKGLPSGRLQDRLRGLRHHPWRGRQTFWDRDRGTSVTCSLLPFFYNPLKK